jgi:hypothetical protein
MKTYGHLHLWIFLRIRNVVDKSSGDCQNTHFILIESFFFSKIMSFIR